MRRSTWVASTAALVVALSGCGGGGPSETAKEGGGTGMAADDPREIVDSWANVSCGSSEVSDWYGAEAVEASETADLDASAQCVREDLSGTFLQKRQLLFVFSSDTALATYLSQTPCPSELGYLRVNGDTWTATTYVQDLATDLVEAGGKLCT